MRHSRWECSNAVAIKGISPRTEHIFRLTACPYAVQLRRNRPATKSALQGKRMAVNYGAADSTVSLGIAFFINAAILILAAAAFYYSGTGEVATLTDAYNLLAPAVGAKAAKILFAVALLAAGQNSSITGTLSGQIVMEGFLHIR